MISVPPVDAPLFSVRPTPIPPKIPPTNTLVNILFSINNTVGITDNNNACNDTANTVLTKNVLPKFLKANINNGIFIK